jgi:hypothetical protein
MIKEDGGGIRMRQTEERGVLFLYEQRRQEKNWGRLIKDG